MKINSCILILICFPLILNSCEKNEAVDPHGFQEDDFYEITINVLYKKNQDTMSDPFSNIYIYYNKEPSHFLTYYYINEGVFYSMINDTIRPDEHLLTDLNGIFIMKEDTINKRNFTVMAESNYKPGMLGSNYYEYRQKNKTITFVFQ